MILFDYLPCGLHYSHSKVNWTLAFQAHLHQYERTLGFAFPNRDFQMLWLIACAEAKTHTLKNWASSLSSVCSLHKGSCFRDILFHTMACKKAWAVWTRSRIPNSSIFLERKCPWSENNLIQHALHCFSSQNF